MHPMLMMALADDVETERRRERQELQSCSLARPQGGGSFPGLRPVSKLARRLRSRLSPRSGLSFVIESEE